MHCKGNIWKCGSISLHRICTAVTKKKQIHNNVSTKEYKMHRSANVMMFIHFFDKPEHAFSAQWNWMTAFCESQSLMTKDSKVHTYKRNTLMHVNYMSAALNYLYIQGYLTLPCYGFKSVSRMWNISHNLTLCIKDVCDTLKICHSVTQEATCLFWLP